MTKKTGSEKTLLTFIAIIALGIAFAGGYGLGLSRDTGAPEAVELVRAPEAEEWTAEAVGALEAPEASEITTIVDYVTPDYIDVVAPYTDVLKAFEIGYSHYLLTDLLGVSFIVYDTLEHGSNYIAYQGLEFELMGYQITDLETFDERAFEDANFLAEELEAYRDSL